MKSKMSKICFSSLILCILIIIGLVLFCLIGSHFSSSDYSWLLAIVLVYSVIYVPYYIAIFIISVICDQKIKTDSGLKNAILTLLLLGPVIWTIKIILNIVLK
jgi:ABC-type polysaccharide transport system permease subunit